MPEVSAEFFLDLGSLKLNVSLRSRARAITITGPSGAGKTSLLRVLAGLESAAQGRVSVLGEPWQDSDAGVFLPPWLRHVGYVPQEATLFPHLSVRDNLAFSRASDAEIEAMARRLELAHLLERAPRYLSGGERQRTALGRALLSRPSLLLLDEPFSALDSELRERAVEVVLDFQERAAVPLVLVTHYGDDCSRLDGEAWRLENGFLKRAAPRLAPELAGVAGR